MSGYVSRTFDEVRKQTLINLVDDLHERISDLGEELMALEEDESTLRIRQSLLQDGYNYLEEGNFFDITIANTSKINSRTYSQLFDEINSEKAKVTKEMKEAIDTYKYVKNMLDQLNEQKDS